ncbi:alpha/beta fold hydrolase [Streptomyces sp. NEAU-YJ-81]|uniref:alpha/beta fold hydrolase n=1 Tax=Streptomyces sp. NEAU-YJ-81 TaxID=2820288 RepID=UPI001ABC5224|nr:alpha/beta hydrolase [Streptomyces sp. NEAU-YJ-81]MBO3680151.1 alpha/beta hydrolase [Streptomyces sp. NEAU-YJ-81]
MSSPALPPEGCAHAHADVNGVRLHYVIGGSGPAIVLLHGWPFSWIEWRAVMPLLAEQGFTVIAPDLRGSGDSSIPAGHWTKRDEAEDLHQLMRHLGHDRACVVGTDVGTMTAHAWAQAYPDEVSRLVLSEAFLPGFGLEEHMNPAAGGSWHFGFHAQSELAAMLTAGKEEQYLSGFWSMMSRGGITDADRRDLLRAYTAPDAMRGGFEHYATLVDDGRAARDAAPSGMPVLVLSGEFGLPQQILLDGARQAARDVRADIVPAAAHTFAADNPAWTAERLARFFTTTPAA